MAGRCAERYGTRSAFSRPRSQILSYPLPSAVRDAQVWDLLSTAQHYEVADEGLYGFAVLVQRRHPHLDQPLVPMVKWISNPRPARGGNGPCLLRVGRRPR